MSVRCIQNSGEYRVSVAVDRVPSSERRDTVSSLRRITRIALFNTSSKPDSGLILSLAKPPTGCPCRKLTLCNIDGAVRPEPAPPACDRQSEQHAGSARPCAAIGAYELHCNIFGKN